MLKNIGIGIDDFKEIIEKDCYFVDKSLFIKDIIDDKSAVKLIARPRRFGKTINMSMLKYFFDIVGAEDNKKLFSEMNIEKENNGEYMKYQGGNPVLFFSMKDIESYSSDLMKESIKDFIREK